MWRDHQPCIQIPRGSKRDACDLLDISCAAMPPWSPPSEFDSLDLFIEDSVQVLHSRYSLELMVMAVLLFSMEMRTKLIDAVHREEMKRTSPEAAAARTPTNVNVSSGWPYPSRHGKVRARDILTSHANIVWKYYTWKRFTNEGISAGVMIQGSNFGLWHFGPQVLCS